MCYCKSKKMLTRDIFLPYVLCTFSFYTWFSYQIWGFLRTGYFVFLNFTLDYSNFHIFFTELVKQSPCLFFHLLTGISFFGVLPCIHCKIEIFNINKSISMLCDDSSRFLSTQQKILLVLTTGFIKAFGLAPCQVVTVCCLCCLFQLHVVSF